ncbi:MAG: ABC transporter permease [Actinomycetota bacterium]
MKTLPKLKLSPLIKRLIFVLAIFGIFVLLKPSFASYDSVLAIVQGIVFVGISSVFLTLLITAGEFDISIGATSCLAAIVTGLLVTNQHMNLWLAILIGLFTGAIVGAINAVVVLYGNVPSFIASISMLFIARSVATYFSQAEAIENFPGLWHGFKESWIGQYFSIIVLIVLIIVGEIILNHTNFGKVVASIGSNKEAARIAGVNVIKTKFLLFIMCGVGAALSGVVAVIHFSSARNTLGSGWELYAIAGLVIGGTSLFGGRGTVIGLFIGLMLMQTIASGLVVANIDPWWQTVITGVIVLVSLGVDKKRKKIFVNEE